MSYHHEHEIKYALDRSRIIIDSNGLHLSDGVFFKLSIYMELMIHLNFLLQVCKKEPFNHKINWNDDMQLSGNSNIKGITDLINNFRNGLCHLDSDRKNADRNKNAILFSHLGPNQKIKISDFEIKNPYNDDIGFVHGKEIVFLRRHIWRIYDELEAFFKKSINYSNSGNF